MRADNPLTENFILNHPVDAARVLETLSPQHCVAFLQAIDEEHAARLLHFFMPGYTGRCLLLMSDDLLNYFTQHGMADVSRALGGLASDQQQSIMQRLGSRLSRQLNNRLSYPGASVGRYFTQRCPVLPATMSTEQALEQLEDMDYEDGCHLNVVDDEHRLLGSIDMARLLTAGKHQTLAKLISKQERPQLLISSQMLELDSHKGWLSYRQLPVVDRHGVYMGELDYEIVRQFQQEFQHTQQHPEAFGSLLSLAGVYWLSVSWLLDCVLGSSDKPDHRGS